jgi:hypothetical protein
MSYRHGLLLQSLCMVDAADKQLRTMCGKSTKDRWTKLEPCIGGTPGPDSRYDE